MKVKVLSRNPDDYIRDTKTQLHKVQRNYDPKLHPFEEQRECEFKIQCEFTKNSSKNHFRCTSTQCNQVGTSFCETLPG